MKENLLHKLYFLLILLMVIPCSQLSAQNCGPANTIYGVSNSNSRTLVYIDTTTGAATTIDDLFGGGNAANDSSKQTSAIALDPTTGIIWLSTRTPAKIYSYTPGAANPYGSTTASFGFSATVNKAAYNPADGMIYFHVGNTLNTLYRFDPATPTLSPVSVGSLGISGTSTTTASFSGGDIAFDGLGNLTGVLNSLNALAVFPAIYDANGVYQGINVSQGVVIANLSAAPTAVAFLPGGDYLVGGPALGVVRVNTNTAVQTNLSTFGTTDFASCAAPAPVLSLIQTATSNCTGVNLVTFTFTIKVRNTGQFAAINNRLFDQLPAGLTVTGATLNGTAIPGAGNTLFSTGNGPLISSTGANAFQNGVMERGDSATIVITATGVPGTYSNQAGLSYTGVQVLHLPNNRVVSDNPATTAVNDATTVTGGCFSLSGTVFNDANGMNNTMVDGTGTGAPASTQLYVNLVNNNGIVLASVAVNSNGTYALLNLPNGSYTAQLSSIQGIATQTAPAQTLPAGWSHTGESFGGVNDPAAGNGLPLTVSGNTSNANFGIERLPESYPVAQTVSGAPVFMNLGNQPLQGSDPEDQTAQGSWTGKTIVIDTLPTNGYILKYNGAAVIPGTPIAAYNPTLLTIEPGPGSGGTATSTFKYATIDAAGKKDASPAPYTINWSIPLPVQLRSFIARAAKDCSIILEWNSGQETQLKDFAVQRSNDGIHFETITLQLPKGNYSSYQYTDKEAASATQYYRILITDRDEKFEKSSVLAIGNECKHKVGLYPNPVEEIMTITGLNGNAATVQIFDAAGKLTMQRTLKAGAYQVNISALATGRYHVLIRTQDHTESRELIKHK